MPGEWTCAVFYRGAGKPGSFTLHGVVLRIFIGIVVSRETSLLGEPFT
jgi:hypothetical protein